MRLELERFLGLVEERCLVQFRLVLAPVWVVTIIEADGDVRPGLVHGQTGKAVLGKARKPELA